MRSERFGVLRQQCKGLIQSCMFESGCKVLEFCLGKANVCRQGHIAPLFNGLDHLGQHSGGFERLELEPGGLS